MLDDNPGELPGYGPVIADIARQTAAQLATTATWHFQVLDHHGTTMAEGILGPTARKTIAGLVDRTGLPAHRRPASLRQRPGPDLPGPGMCQTSAPLRHRPHLRLDLLPGRHHLEHVRPL